MKLVTVLRLIILAAIGVGIIFGLYTLVNFYDKHIWYSRMRETPAVRPYEKPMLLMEKGTVPVKLGEEQVKQLLKKGQLPPTDLSTEDLVTLGKKEYQTFCSHCHGVNMDGLGTVGQSFNPLPTNLLGERVRHLTDAEIFGTISYGTARSPALATSMTIQSRNAVIHYIRSRQNAM